jgi:hypothetical protein
MGSQYQKKKSCDAKNRQKKGEAKSEGGSEATQHPVCAAFSLLRFHSNDRRERALKHNGTLFPTPIECAVFIFFFFEKPPAAVFFFFFCVYVIFLP